LFWASIAQAAELRIATFAAPLSRDGPGLLLRDIQKGEDDSLTAITFAIAQAAPDVLVLTDFDYDLDGLALAAFAQGFGADYPYLFARRPNAGLATGYDIDGNGWTGEARDAQGYGRFAGDGGIAILSRYPVAVDAVTDLSTMLWRDLPDAVLPQVGGAPFFPSEVQDILRLSSTAHWIVPIRLPDDTLVSIMAFAATPQVFDGPEDMNGLRSRDELKLWEHVLDGTFGPPPDSFILAGNSNLDPTGGQGDRAAMAAFLARDDLNDPHPGTTNADWGADSTGKLRVSYVLPSSDWRIIDAGLTAADVNGGTAGGPHSLVWVDVSR